MTVSRTLAVALLAGALLAVALPAVALPAAALPAGALPAARSAPAPDPPLVVSADAFAWPLAGVDGTGAPERAGETGTATRLFDPPPHYYGRGHRGVDLAGHPGLTVLAAGAGTVVFAGRVAGRGVVSVEHGAGLRTTYEPVTVTVALGAAVRRGDPLGALEPGHRGCPVAACLHWGLRRPSPTPAADALQYLDPLLLLGLGRVRLLPTDP
ncbi:M23 family metallopeptidase [Actinomycetospora cinnamomea]|uniref:Peptidase M23-like protein n=1 Tax=Actinomycetospora cinnamomea TaxID=663609 RepID=A0A2U1FQN1_9PSEU|nr:M23 family metallopeptidase [Actinomycetospora cinnamomea]PVZ14491.1 peptidase M23-like protein [Actinomycetospora cinnamomea]